MLRVEGCSQNPQDYYAVPPGDEADAGILPGGICLVNLNDWGYVTEGQDIGGVLDALPGGEVLISCTFSCCQACFYA